MLRSMITANDRYSGTKILKNFDFSIIKDLFHFQKIRCITIFSFFFGSKGHCMVQFVCSMHSNECFLTDDSPFQLPTQIPLWILVILLFYDEASDVQLLLNNGEDICSVPYSKRPL